MRAIVLTRSVLTTLPVIGLAAALMLATPSDVRADHQWMSQSGSVGFHWKRVDVDPLVLRVKDNHDVYVSNDGTWVVDWPTIQVSTVNDLSSPAQRFFTVYEISQS